MNLDSILDRGTNAPPRIIIYGEAGLGKTTWSGDFPKDKLLFIPIEDGMAALPKDVLRTEQPKNFEELNDQIKILREFNHDYKVVVIDSASKVEQLINNEVSKESNVKNISEIGWQQGFQIAGNKFEKFLDSLDSLRREKKMIIVIICHSIVEKVKPPVGDPFDKYTLSLHKHSRERVKEWADIILFMKYNFFIDSETKKAISKGERILYTAQNPGYDAECRYPGLPEEIKFDNKKEGLGNFLKILKKAIKKGE